MQKMSNYVHRQWKVTSYLCITSDNVTYSKSSVYTSKFTGAVHRPNSLKMTVYNPVKSVYLASVL